MVATSFVDAAQSKDEERAFVAAFARMNIALINKRIKEERTASSSASVEPPDWDDVSLLKESGLTTSEIDASCRAGEKFLHIEVARQHAAFPLIASFMLTAGLSEKQSNSIFPILSKKNGRGADRTKLGHEVSHLNDWLRTAYATGSDKKTMEAYRAAVRIHGQLQNITGEIGATGAAIAFIDAIRSIDCNAIVDVVGTLPPTFQMSPKDVGQWHDKNRANHKVKAILLNNGRAIIFESSKDANIVQSLKKTFSSAQEALDAFKAVQMDQDARSQALHEFVVGEIKTATDPANLHERLGLASRETQTELRTDRFLMMAILNDGILRGGIQGRQMNNRDLTRFSDVFNLHHCWGWDGGRDRHPDHWQYFVAKVKIWCGL